MIANHIKRIIPIILFQSLLFTNATAHPGSGIVVDKYGNVYFIYKGIVKISGNGSISFIHKAPDGHWLCLNESGSFSKSNPTYFERINADGANPAFIFAGGGSPILVNKDGNLFYCGGEHGDLNPGAKTIVRETAKNQLSSIYSNLEDTLDKFDDGITSITGTPDGSIFLGCWNSIIRVGIDGRIKVLAHPAMIVDCDEDPADHRETNRGKPLLRGIALDSACNIYVAATSCHCIARIGTDGKSTTILKSERPWSPTGLAFRDGNLYVLEYTNANGPATEGWFPRVRKIDSNGKITVMADLSKKAN
jgi:hypothetical protein